jgi:hypothetical protein
VSRPICTLPPGKTRYPLYRRLGGPRPVWTGAENLAPTGIRSPDCPARRQSLYRLCYPAHTYGKYRYKFFYTLTLKCHWATFHKHHSENNYYTEFDLDMNVLSPVGHGHVDEHGLPFLFYFTNNATNTRRMSMVHFIIFLRVSLCFYSTLVLSGIQLKINTSTAHPQWHI